MTGSILRKLILPDNTDNTGGNAGKILQPERRIEKGNSVVFYKVSLISTENPLKPSLFRLEKFESNFIN